MKFSLASVLAFVATVAMAAEVTDPKFDSVPNPAKGTVIPAGAEVPIAWTFDDPKYAKGDVKVELLGGKTPETLQKLDTLIEKTPNSNKLFVWKVSADLGSDAVYGLKFISLEYTDIVQFSQPFHIKGSDIKSQSGSSQSSTGSATGTQSGSVTKTDSSTKSTSPVSSTGRTNSTTSGSTGMTTQPTATSTDKAASSTKPATSSTSSAAAAAMVGSTVAAVGGIVAALLAL